MFRKLVGCLLIIGIIATSSLTAFAAPVESNDKSTSQSAISSKEPKPDYTELLHSVIRDATPDTTDEFLVDITKPSSDTEVVTYRSYNICGTPIKSDIKVFFARYNEDTRTYQLIANTDGDTFWQGESQFFSNDITLEKGANKFKIVAYRTSQENDLTKGDIQVTTFTISYVEKTLIDKAFDFFKDIFKK